MPYSSKLFAGEFGGGGPVTAFTVPAGYVYVVRDIDGVSLGTNNALVASCQPEDINFAQIIGETSDELDLVSYTWRGRQVFVAGDELQLAADYPDMSARVSGYILSAP